MKKNVIALFLISISLLQAQDVLISKTSKVHFFSSTPLENIEASSTQSVSAINKKTGEVTISIPIRSFKFEKALMQEHFNENYMESDKYPNASFKGKITNISAVDFSKDGIYKVNVMGDLNIHGVAKTRTIEAIITITNGEVTATSKFKVPLEDHKITKPQIVFTNIADIIDVDVTFGYSLYVKK